jgi:folate-dependent phosphoribosylglycinamide formyltransferase PurN
MSEPKVKTVQGAKETDVPGMGGEGQERRMRTLLICHEGADLDRLGLAGWLSSFSELCGIVVLREKGGRMRQRVRREMKRVGAARFLDVLAFRAYYKLFLAARDRRWEQQTLNDMSRAYPGVKAVPELITHSPNSPEAEEFIRESGADIVIARCKTLLKESIFSLPTRGTFVMHPGICPEYRNAHGCFWALANDDVERVGMTLLRIDKGVDTGPVYGFYSYAFDELEESHLRIQHRVVLENLGALEKKLLDIYRGEAVPVDTKGKASAVWGQPWLSRYLKWKRRAKRRARRGEAAIRKEAHVVEALESRLEERPGAAEPDGVEIR